MEDLGLGSGRDEIWGWEQGEMRYFMFGSQRGERFRTGTTEKQETWDLDQGEVSLGVGTMERWNIWSLDQGEVGDFLLGPERAERFRTGTKERWEI